MKQCSKCKDWKSKGEFYKTPGSKDGLKGSCKECYNTAVSLYHKTPKGRSATRLAQSRYQKSKKGKRVILRSKQSGGNTASHSRYRNANQEKIKAQRAVNYEAEIGRIPPISTQVCISCGNQAENYHHNNGYDKENWFDVIPMCIECHKKKHRKG